MLTIRSALFRISETLVDESKQHITAEQAVKKIREYLRQTDYSKCKECENTTRKVAHKKGGDAMYPDGIPNIM